MLKAVPDVNIYISGVIKREGHANQIFKRAAEFTLYSSEPILKDLERVLHYDRVQKKFKLSEAKIIDYLSAVRDTHLLTPGLLEVSIVHDDPDDDKIVACALEAEADYIISGDHHLLNLKHYRDIQIVTPKAFLEILDQEKASA